MRELVFRVQNKSGRGPFMPGLSRYWVIDRPDHINLKPHSMDFPDIKYPKGMFVGCACRTKEQLQRWFSEQEYKSLLEMGFKSVSLPVNKIIAESDTQLVVANSVPFTNEAVEFNLWG